MNGQLERQVRSHTIDSQAVRHILPRADATMPRGSRDDANIVTCLNLGQCKGSHLRLDAPGSGQIAISDMGDPHRP